MVLYLGIDGGGTGCRAAIADESGRILGQGQAGPANIRSDTEGSLGNILAATRLALQQAGLEARRLGELQALLGLAGANVTEAADRLAAMLPFAGARIVSDGLTTTRGALGLDDGVVAAIGTGSVFSVQRGGRIRQVGGRGFMLGDEGSGAALGRALLADTLRAEDGLLPMTPLLAETLDSFGGEGIGGEAIIAWSFRAAPVEYAALAPRITRSTDPAALAIMTRACARVSRIIDALQGADDPLPVVFIGGLGPDYASRIGPRWPAMAPVGSALDGAVQLALEGLSP